MHTYLPYLINDHFCAEKVVTAPNLAHARAYIELNTASHASRLAACISLASARVGWGSVADARWTGVWQLSLLFRWSGSSRLGWWALVRLLFPRLGVGVH